MQTIENQLNFYTREILKHWNNLSQNVYFNERKKQCWIDWSKSVSDGVVIKIENDDNDKTMWSVWNVRLNSSKCVISINVFAQIWKMHGLHIRDSQFTTST